MIRYIALLRGINVGGRNKISMPLLKSAFEDAGFSDVTTYINSGNVIFSSAGENEINLIEKCEALIKNKFELSIRVTVISAADLADALANAPDWWDNDGESKHNAIFVIPPAAAAEVMEQVGAAKPEYERVGCYGQVIFWSAPLKTFSKTRWSKITAASAYDSITIRNANTAGKLAALTQ